MPYYSFICSHMKYLSLFPLLFITLSSFSQEEIIFQRELRDHIWLLGFSALYDPNDSDFMIIDFKNGLFEYEGLNLDYNFYLSNSSIADKEGNLLCYTNGIEIRNFNHDSLAYNLAPTALSQGWLDSGYPIVQGSLFLPVPESDSIYYLFHEGAEWGGIEGVWIPNLFYTVVNMSANDGNGLVGQRNIPIVQDTLAFGRIVATRHANGRDWWVIVPKYTSNTYYSVLFTSDGIESVNSFQFGDTIQTGGFQSTFTPDGSKYLRMDITSVGENKEHKISLYDFDRSTGEFTSYQTFSFFDWSYGGGGLAVSENSRFVYATSIWSIYQYDLWAEDIAASKVKVLAHDGFEDEGQWSTTFQLAQLAPDGKIYIAPSSDGRFLHTIHKPNLKGLACQAEQRAISLPISNWESIPNHAYYGLGPLDGSPCDTLNINNPTPQVAFDYVIIDSTAFSVDFYDGSIFNPEEWYWDFGDGFSSTDRFPSHTYAEYGSYEVCLTASNDTGSNTVCQEISLGVTGTGYETKGIEYRVWPNPASEILHISAAIPFSGSSLTLYSMDGKNALSQLLPDGGKTVGISIELLNAGVYILEVKDDEGRIWRKRVVID